MVDNIDYKTLLKTVVKYSEESERIFNKLHKVDLDSKTFLLNYGSYALFESVNWNYSDENYLEVFYYNFHCDYVDSSEISIPVDIFFNEEKIDKWIETKISERKELPKTHHRLMQIHVDVWQNPSQYDKLIIL